MSSFICLPFPMQTLVHKKIIVGISGGIAAYKSAELVRGLIKAGAEVQVVMTKAAQEFITPLTMQALSGNSVHTELLDEEAEAGMGHIQLAKWADLIIIAPASANTISKIACGAGEDLLSTLCLAASAPLVIAPAMNQEMWHQSATQANLQTLIGRGVLQWGPASGQQACGDVGLGRMLEADELVERAKSHFKTGSLAGKTVTVTAGPTREAIDPVRYISNHSSGKMGYALAEAAAEAGALVKLISGPTGLQAPTNCDLIAVESAADMLSASLDQSGCDLFIAAAAVADYTPQKVSSNKIKKSSEKMTIELEKTQDIVATISALEQRPFVVGFAAETQNLAEYARNKLERKKLDLIIGNDVSQQGIGFNSDDNAVTLFWRDGREETLDQRSKTQLARELISRIAEQIH